jgi:hypothetical protein
MTPEKTSYSNNLNDFRVRLKNVFIKRIYFDTDKAPEFNKDTVPFDFEYCYTVGILTDNEYIVIQTSMTDNGIETFWTKEQNDLSKPVEFLEINCKLNAIKIDNSSLDIPYKITLDFENRKVICVCGEIYKTDNDIYDYKINDEMILCFTNDKDVEAYEKLTNNR